MTSHLSRRVFLAEHWGPEKGDWRGAYCDPEDNGE